jgi:hypothetical protein
MLTAAAEQPGGHVVHSLYALALIDAEGGHYQEVRSATKAAVSVSLGDSAAWYTPSNHLNRHN